MSRPFWLFRTSLPATPPSALPPDCESIEPLLPLYADRMASPEEVRSVEAHLPGCEGCRKSLFWMQATHRALASRPVAVPPANLQVRIAEAIAASSAAPISLRSARSFTLRPAYAAAASLTVLGGVILSYSLLHPPVSSVPSVGISKHVPPMVAFVPPATQKVNNIPPHAVRVKLHQTLAARNVPAATPQHDAAKSVTAEHAPKTVPVNAVALSNRIADNAPAPVRAVVPPHVSVKPGPYTLAVQPKKLMASTNVPPTEKRHPSAPETALVKPRTEVAMLPRHEEEPLSAQVHIGPATVVPQPATVKTASFTVASGGLLAGVKAFAIKMSTVAPGKTSLMERQISRGGTNAMQALDHEHLAVVDIHGPGSP